MARSNNKNNSKSGRKRNRDLREERVIERPTKFTKLGRQIYGFPARLEVPLRYHMTTALTSTTGNTARQIFRWNSIFDVDFTGTGHQPLYHDTYQAIYNHYVVVKAHARIKFINTSVSPVLVGIVTDDSTTTSTTLDTLAEQNTGKQEILPPISGAFSTKTFIQDWDYAQWFNVNPYSSESAKTTFGADPTDIAALVCYMGTLDATTATMYMEAEIVQTVLFTELVTPTQS